MTAFLPTFSSVGRAAAVVVVPSAVVGATGVMVSAAGAAAVEVSAVVVDGAAATGVSATVLVGSDMMLDRCEPMQRGVSMDVWRS